MGLGCLGSWFWSIYNIIRFAGLCAVVCSDPDLLFSFVGLGLPDFGVQRFRFDGGLRVSVLQL